MPKSVSRGPLINARLDGGALILKRKDSSRSSTDDSHGHGTSDTDRIAQGKGEIADGERSMNCPALMTA
jgi:hypothetical protein